MAGYVRQSVADIVNGANITAPPLNAEFNTLASAFNGTTGHTHTGGIGDGPKIELTTSVAGYLPQIHGGVGGKNNTQAITNPTSANDVNSGYAPGSVWINATTGRLFICVNNTASSAAWVEGVGITPLNQITPENNNTVDIGSPSYQFKDIHIDGTGYIDGLVGDTLSLTSNASVGGSLSVTGAIAGSSTLTVASDASVGGNLDVTGITILGGTSVNGTLTATGNVSIGNSTTDTIAIYSRISTSLIPSVDDSFDLGIATNQWKNLWIDGTANIDSLNANLVNLDDGSIDNIDIGAGTPATAAFTTLDVTTSADFAGATISNLGTVTTADINGGSIDGVTIGTNSAVTDLRVDNIKVDGNAITSTNTNGNIDLTPNGSGEVNISKVDINSGTIDGTTIGATSHTTGKFTTLQSTGQATLATVDINGGAIDGTAIGGSVTSTGAFTTVSASGGFTGALTGNVTGNVTGNLTGNVTGNVTGNLSGNVTSTGTSTFNDVTISGTLNMDAGTTATITNLSTPVNAGDAATKGYVDTSVADLIDLAPGALDTLNELAAALGDDANFATNVYQAIDNQVNASGDTMTGTLDMGANKVTTTLTPTTDSELTRKAYVDAQRDTRVAKAGDSMSGNLAMGGNNITGLADPVNAQDAATKIYIDSVFGSTVSAAASASAAATSETNAANSATASANSAAAALASEQSAASLLDQFDDRYLGSKTSAPLVDNDGNALLNGALYFNSANNIMYVYGSSGWQPAGSSVNGTSDRYSYTATASQTTFSGVDNNGSTLAYDSGYVDVYLNGVRLVDGVDFTATSGTSIQLTTAASTGDSLEVVAYGTFSLATHYTKIEADARFLNVVGDSIPTLNVTTVDFGDWTITESGGSLYFATGGTNKMKLNADGTLDVAGDINANATIS